MNTQEICNHYQQKVSTLFSGFLVKIYPFGGLGSNSIFFRIANVPSENDAPYGIVHNATLHLGGLIQQEGNGFKMENPIHSGEGLKFRKISGKTEVEVLEKFVAWLTKNETAIKAIVPRYRNG